MSKAKRQMPGQLGRVGVARGEAARDLVSDEVCGPPREHPDTGSAKPKAGTGGLLETALTRANLQAAWKRRGSESRPTKVQPESMGSTSSPPPECCNRGGRRFAKSCWQASTGPKRYAG